MGEKTQREEKLAKDVAKKDESGIYSHTVTQLRKRPYRRWVGEGERVHNSGRPSQQRPRSSNLRRKNDPIERGGDARTASLKNTMVRRVAKTLALVDHQATKETYLREGKVVLEKGGGDQVPQEPKGNAVHERLQKTSRKTSRTSVQPVQGTRRKPQGGLFQEKSTRTSGGIRAGRCAARRSCETG